MRAAFTGSQQPRTSRQPGSKTKCPMTATGSGSPLGSIVYTVDLHGPPGSVSQEQALAIASTYYERLTAA